MLKKYLPLVIVIVLVLWLGFSIIPGVLGETPTPAATVTVTSAPPSTQVSIADSTTVPPTNTSAPTSEHTPTSTSTPAPTLTSTDTPAPPPTDTPTPTSTPTPTFTPIPTAEAVVLANELNLRAGPGTVYDSIGVLRQGDALDVQGRIPSNEWIQVNPISLDTSGWVATGPGLVQILADLNTIPIAEVPPTPIPLITPTPTSSIIYSVPTLTNPDNGVGTFGSFPPLYWTWDGELGENEFFEVRVWHESITTYHPALGWVKVPQFDYNVSGERNGKYYWTVAIVQGADPKPKDWTLQPMWPYPMWEGTLVGELSPESEPRFFFFTPDKSKSGGGGSPISKPNSGIEN